jgi:hypothetical protein
MKYNIPKKNDVISLLTKHDFKIVFRKDNVKQNGKLALFYPEISSCLPRGLVLKFLKTFKENKFYIFQILNSFNTKKLNIVIPFKTLLQLEFKVLTPSEIKPSLETNIFKNIEIDKQEEVHTNILVI